MKLAQEMLITAKDEEDHIFETVDYHATQIAKELDQQRRELYIDFRDNIMHERFVRAEAQRVVKKIEERVSNDIRQIEREEQVETDIDPPTPRKYHVEAGPKEVINVFTKPRADDYHLYNTCKALIGQEPKCYYDLRTPCKFCVESAEDVLNSGIGAKWIGFIPNKDEYHDDECLCWIGHKPKEKRKICRECEKEREMKVYYEDIIATLKNTEEEKGRSTSSGSKKTTKA